MVDVSTAGWMDGWLAGGIHTFVMLHEQDPPGVLAEAKLVVESIRADRQLWIHYCGLAAGFGE